MAMAEASKRPKSVRRPTDRLVNRPQMIQPALLALRRLAFPLRESDLEKAAAKNGRSAPALQMIPGVNCTRSNKAGLNFSTSFRKYIGKMERGHPRVAQPAALGVFPSY